MLTKWVKGIHVPHIIIEYSDGITPQLSVQKLVERLHAVVLDIEALPVGGLRVRAYAPDQVCVADGQADRDFIYVIVRIGQGRTEAVKRDIGDRLFAELKDHTQDLYAAGHSLSLGLEIQEIEKDWTWKHNNIHQILKDQQDG